MFFIFVKFYVEPSPKNYKLAATSYRKTILQSNLFPDLAREVPAYRAGAR